MTNPRMIRWCLPGLLVTLSMVPLGCDEGGDDEETADDETGDDPSAADDDTNPMPTTTTMSTTTAAMEGGDMLVCGLIDTSLGACDVCAAESCCAAFETCATDAGCYDCFYNPPSATDPSSPCYTNPAYMGLMECVSGPCAAACGNDGGSGDGSGGSCNQTQCSDGPGGNAACQAMGCGDCSFGFCLIF